MWSGWRLTREQQTSRPDHFWPELLEKMGKNAKLKEKQKWSHEKLHLDNARRLRGIAIRSVGMVNPIESKQNLRVFWKLVNLQDCVWENHCRLIMKTILQEKVKQFTTALQSRSQIYSYALSHENSSSKGSSGQGVGKIGEIFGVEPDESQK